MDTKLTLRGSQLNLYLTGRICSIQTVIILHCCHVSATYRVGNYLPWNQKNIMLKSMPQTMHRFALKHKISHLIKNSLKERQLSLDYLHGYSKSVKLYISLFKFTVLDGFKKSYTALLEICTVGSLEARKSNLRNSVHHLQYLYVYVNFFLLKVPQIILRWPARK